MVDSKLDNKDISGEKLQTPYLGVKRYSDIEYNCGSISEIYQYENPVYYNTSKVQSDIFLKSPKGHGKDRQGNLLRSFRRRKQRIRRLINSNNVGKSSFLTLTYKDNMISQSQGYKDLNNFLKRLRYHYPQFNKYLYCIERQERGAIHFHLVFFDVPKIDNEILSKLWGKGFIRINKTENVNNLGAYMTKYMSKESQKLALTGRIWGHSKNLSEYEIIKAVSFVQADRNRDYSKVLYSQTFDCSFRGKVNFYIFRN